MQFGRSAPLPQPRFNFLGTKYKPHGMPQNKQSKKISKNWGGETDHLFKKRKNKSEYPTHQKMNEDVSKKIVVIPFISPKYVPSTLHYTQHSGIVRSNAHSLYPQRDLSSTVAPSGGQADVPTSCYSLSWSRDVWEDIDHL